MLRLLSALALAAVVVGSCSTEPASPAPDAGTPAPADAAAAALEDAAPIAPPDAESNPAPDADLEPDASLEPDAAALAVDAGHLVAIDAGPVCFEITSTASVVAQVAKADEYALYFDAASASATSWGQVGNEALILEVLAGSGVVAHVVLHQGATSFTYATQTGALATGDAISLRVSPLSATAATPRAHVCSARLVSASAGVLHAPIVLWPVKKRFDDLPVLLAWSAKAKHYEMVYTSENGGTVVQCGGGALGMEGEYARWGRGHDMEAIDNVGGAWDHCDLKSLGDAGVPAPRTEAGHRILYFGDNHNRLYVSRGGYGQVCGTGSAEMADGPIDGFNANNPGNDPAHDAPYVIAMRLVPVDLDAVGYSKDWHRREAIVDTYAPWVYRLTALELTREGKIDGVHCMPMDRYLYVDLQVGDVGGSGDMCNILGVKGGFKLRVNTSLGTQLSSAQVTKDFAGGALLWKRVAIPLDRTYTASQLTGFVFDAYDNDGCYLLALGDAFMPRAQGDDGATLDYVHQGVKAIGVYVDDDSSGCVGGVSSGGPPDGGYRCVGGAYSFKP